MSGRVLGIDIGATNLRACTLDEDNAVAWSDRAALDTSDPPGSIVRQIEGMVGNHPGSFSKAGVGVAGFVSMRRNLVLRIPNADLGETDVASALGAAFGVTPVILNDAVAAVVAEREALHSGVQDMAYVTLSTGIGGAAFLGGRLVAGSEGNSHEVGHIVVDYTGLMQCACGGRGHWESYCSGANVPAYAAKLASREGGRELERLLSGGALSPERVFGLCKRGDAFGRVLMKELCRMNAAGLASVVNVYWPEVLVIGGSLALNNWDEFIVPSVQAAQKMLAHPLPEFRKSFYGDMVSAVGAAIFARSPSSYF
ncbi:MAG: ROK family protein [Nitrososphaerota archaeon]|nr:ROK family protein [Nitrososphaerota archaeon]MDG6939961.1 ROK family protein [Nitrososphaerota archaeon]